MLQPEQWLIQNKNLDWDYTDKKRKSTLSSDWSQQLADELHKQITRNFDRFRFFITILYADWETKSPDLVKSCFKVYGLFVIKL